MRMMQQATCWYRSCAACVALALGMATLIAAGCMTAGAPRAPGKVTVLSGSSPVDVYVIPHSKWLAEKAPEGLSPQSSWIGTFRQGSTKIRSSDARAVLDVSGLSRRVYVALVFYRGVPRWQVFKPSSQPVEIDLTPAPGS